MKTNPFILFSILLFVIFSQCGSRQSPYIYLQLNLPVGDEESYISEFHSSGSSISLFSKKEIGFKVTSRSKGVYNFDVDLKYIYSENNFGSGVEKYDSRNEESLMTETALESHKEFKSSLDSTMTISLHHTGALESPLQFENGDSVKTQIFDFENFQIVFPERRLKEGNIWNNEWPSLVYPSKMFKATYTLEKIHNDQIVIDVNQTTPSFESLLNSNILKGKYVLDRKTGKLILGYLKTELQTGGFVKMKFSRKK